MSTCLHKWQNHHSVPFPQVPHLVKVTLESSPYFQLVGPNDVYRKVPPGLPLPVRILFTPAENKVSLQDPRDWCLQCKVNLQGCIQDILAWVLRTSAGFCGVALDLELGDPLWPCWR